MKQVIFFIVVFIGISCNNFQSPAIQKIELESMKNILLGKDMGLSVQEIENSCAQEFLSAKAFGKKKKNQTVELDLYLYPKIDSSYQQLVQFYNLHFSANNTDSIFNSWRSETCEFILYKNSDSSILVNILKRK